MFRLDLGLTADQVEELVAARLERQAILDREHSPRLTAVIDEAALQRFAEGCAGVLAEQLRHLVACVRRPPSADQRARAATAAWRAFVELARTH